MLLHPRIDAVLGHDDAADDQRAVRRAARAGPRRARRRQPRRPPNTWISRTASNAASRERQPLAVRLHQPRRAPRRADALRELAQHAERQVDADIVVARRHERPADAPGAGAEIEQARLRRVDRGEHRRADRLRHALRQRAMALEARRGGVVIGHQHGRHARRSHRFAPHGSPRARHHRECRPKHGAVSDAAPAIGDRLQTSTLNIMPRSSWIRIWQCMHVECRGSRRSGCAS